MVLEATGGIELAATGSLADAGLLVAVVNPRQVRDFAKAIGRLAKTDRLDAQVIAQFGEVVQPMPRPLRDAEAQALSALLSRRRQLVGMMTQEKNRLHAAQLSVQRDIRGHIVYMEKRLAKLMMIWAALCAKVHCGESVMICSEVSRGLAGSSR